MATGTAVYQPSSAPSAVPAPPPAMLFREFTHVAANDEQTRVLKLWKVMNASGVLQNFVTFNNNALYGNWCIALNADNSIAHLWVMFDLKENEARAVWHGFTPIINTNDFRSKFNYADAKDAQSLHDRRAHQHFALAPAVVDESQYTRHHGMFMHVAAHWKDARPLSLWSVSANGETRHFVSFDNKRMHGSWNIAPNPDGSIALLNIKFHFDADERLAYWHSYVPIEGTSDFRSIFDARRPYYSQTLHAVHAIQQAM